MTEADASLAQAIEDDIGGAIGRTFNFSGAGARNVFLGHFRTPGAGIPDEAVFVEESGGTTPGRIYGDDNIDFRAVQVLYRGPRKQVIIARKTAREIRRALEKIELAGIIYVHALESSPLAAGLNSNERSIFSMNFDVAIKE